MRKLKNFIILPKIYEYFGFIFFFYSNEYFGFIFFFYSNEHEPIHVHVIKGECQTVFELIIKDGTLAEVRKRAEKGYAPLNEKDTGTAEVFVRAYYKKIIDKWMNFFILKKRVRCTQIKRRVKA